MRKIYSILLLLLLSFSLHAQKLTIAVAANAQYVMKELKKQYKKETGADIDLIIGSSGKLTAQIKEGAPYHLFLSADTSYPKVLYNEGYTAGEPKIYAYGTLVLWTYKDNIDLLNINIVTESKVKKIAVANPKLAPYGVATEQALKYYKIYDRVESKIVYGESIAQVNQYVTTSNTEVGFTAKSVVLSDEMKNKGKWIEISHKAYNPIAQAMVLLKYAEGHDKEAAKKFYDYLLSDKSKQLFKKYGYTF